MDVSAKNRVRTVWFSVGITLLFTFIAAACDGIVKHFASGFEAPQLFVLSALCICVFSVITARATAEKLEWRTEFPKAMAGRCVFACTAVAGYYYAFKFLDFAEVFLFIGLAPLLSGVVAKPILGDRVGARSWLALAGGGIGVALLFPSAPDGKLVGYLAASIGVLTGTLSIVLTRYISQREYRPMSLMLYTHVVMAVVMLAALPSVYKPMDVVDLLWVALYALLMFLSRWLALEAVKRVPVHFFSLLVNSQFIWMVLIGAAVFSEWPSANVFIGAAVLIGASVVLVKEQLWEAREPTHPADCRVVK